MNLKDKRNELSLLKSKKKYLVDEKNKILSKKYNKFKTIFYLMLSGIVFIISFNLFFETAPIFILLNTCGALCFFPGISYHRKKVRVQILDTDINILNSDIDVLQNEIRELERKNLLDMVSAENLKKQTELFNEVRKHKRMPEFNRENIESNISNVDLGMKLSLHR